MHFEQAMMVGGALLLGIVLGVVMLRALMRWGSKFMADRAPCSTCREVGFQFTCERCKKSVGMCHAYHILLTDSVDPAKIRARPSRDLCTLCVTEDERNLLEGPR